LRCQLNHSRIRPYGRTARNSVVSRTA
jgi:hypothetical protein